MRTIVAWMILGGASALAVSCGGDDDTSNGGSSGAIGGTGGTDAGTAANGGAAGHDEPLGTAANGGAGDGVLATCQSFVETLTDCQVITGTRFKGCADDDPTLKCLAGCVARVTCEDVKATYCFHSDNAYTECLGDCKKAEKPPQFTCGDGSMISARWQCDGVADCPGGEDEDCPDGVFACASGPSIPAGWHCDGIEDCAGGDDEADCGPPFTCDDGTTVPSSKECNGDNDCARGEDETDCTTLTCT